MRETGTQARTRRAILDAAVAVLSHNAGASLSDIAAAARVGRTTVHRYFPERAALMTAIGADALDQVTAATERARLADGPAMEALVRLCHELFDLGDVLMLLFLDPVVMAEEAWQRETESDRAFLRLIERGHADGTIDAEAPPQWVQGVLWALLYAAWEHSRDYGAPRHDALALCARTVRRALAP